MKKRMKALLMASLLLLPLTIWAQYDDFNYNRDYNFISINEVIPSAAEYQAMKHFGMSKCNGKLDVSIPLLELQHRDVNLPIYLSYNTAGIKVASVASRVGQNWHLTAGGRITRVQKGSNFDFLITDYGFNDQCKETIYYGWQNHSENISVDLTCSGMRTTYVYDLEPDVFYLSAPGLSTTFYINKQKKAVEVRGDDIKLSNISYKYNGDINGLTIISNKGVIYRFSETVESIKIYPDIRCGFSNSSGVNESIALEWLLTSMQYPSGTILSFGYDKEGANHRESMESLKIDKAKVSESPSNQIDIHTTGGESIIKQILTPNRLRTISVGNSSLVFIYHHCRKDIEDYALNEILLKYNNELVKKVVLGYDYLRNEQGEESRLLLTQVKKVGRNEEIGSVYTLDYNLGAFPDYKSFKYDCFGFFADNGQTGPRSSTYAYFKSDVTRTQYSPFPVTAAGYNRVDFPANSRVPVEADMKTGMLTRIIYPTGGVMSLTYEANEFNYLGSTIKGGGLRIAKQKMVGGDEEWLREYRYGSAVAKIPRIGQLATSVDLLAEETLAAKIQFIKDYTVRYSSSQVNLELLNGSPVAYRSVEEIQPGNGKIVSYYSLNKHTQVEKEFSVLSDNYLDFNPTSDWPFWEGQLSVFNGKKYEEFVIDELGRVVKGTRYVREFKPYANELVPIEVNLHKQFSQCDFDPDDIPTLTGHYTLEPGKLELKEKYVVEYPKEKAYAIRDLDLRRDFDYPYHPDFSLWKKKHVTFIYDGYNRLIEKREYNYNSRTKIEGYTYVSPFSSGVHAEMASRYMMNLPVKSYTYFKEPNKEIAVAGGEMTHYSIISNNVLPTKTEVLNIPSNFIPDKQSPDQSGRYYVPNDSDFDPFANFGYDNAGNLRAAHYENDVNHLFEWGYGGQYAVAEIKNAEAYEVAYTHFETQTELNRDWRILGNRLFTDDARIGEFAYVQAGSTLQTAQQIPAGTYKLSCYAKKTGGGTITGNYTTNMPIFPTDEWQYFQRTIQVDTDKIIALEMNDGVMVDELRLIPIDAQMTTYSYEPLVGLKESVDANGRITCYEYDAQGRLRLVKDHEGNIINKYEYKLKNEK
jgi:YD repeat-containing protein